MHKLFLLGTVAAALALPSITFAHGGTYRGPGDITPPGGGGGGGGGSGTPSSPATPGQPGPSRPTPGAGSPGAPPGSPGSGPRNTPGGGDATDLSAWQFWWAFNKDAYLALKAHILSGEIVTGSDEFYLGRGERRPSRDTLRVSAATIREVIVPRLLEALAKDSSPDVQSSCMVALAKIPDSRDEGGTSKVTEAIRARLSSSNQELAETAAVALGIQACNENIPVLAALLENDAAVLRASGVRQEGNVPTRTRAFAAYGLGLIGHQASEAERISIQAKLCKLLDGEGKTMAQRDIQVACITSIGLMPLAIDASDAAGVTGRAPVTPRTRQDQLRYLLAFYADDSNNPLIRAHAPTAMARLLDTGDLPAAFPLREAVAKRCLETLSKASREPAAMQQSCALALGRIGDCDGDPLDREIRAALMRVQEELADQQTRDFALIGLADASGRPGQGAGDALEGVSTADRRQNSRAFLLGQLSKGRDSVRPWSGLALAVMERGLEDAGGATSSDVLLALRSALVEARSPSDVGALSIACGIAHDRGASQVLQHELDVVRDVEARGCAAIGLGLIDDQAALPAIRHIVRKSKYQPELLKSSAIALGLLGDRQVVGELVDMLATATGLASQAAISAALGTIGDAHSVDPLVRLLQDQEVPALARAFAAVALGIVADKEPLPWNAKLAAGSNYRASTPSLTDQKGGILDIL